MSDAYDRLQRRLKEEQDARTPGGGTSAGSNGAPGDGVGDRHSDSHSPTDADPGHWSSEPAYLPPNSGPSSTSPAGGRSPVLAYDPSRVSSGREPQGPGGYIAADDRDHPLHKVYRRRIRGIRARWLGSGVLLGALGGILVTLLASALVVKTFPSVLQTITGQPDVQVILSEDYLNKASASRLKSGYSAGGQYLQVTGLAIDVQPGDRMALRATFSANVVLTTLNFNAGVDNDLTVQDGKLVFNMSGDPQLGNLNVPLDMLPFNLKDSVRQSIDKIDNDLLASEINRAVGSSVSSGEFAIDSISTTDATLNINLRQR